MSISLGNDGKGRRKPVDGDLNLVPYIDLLTCMVAFLLITAVWSQLARLSVAQKGQGQADDVALADRFHLAVLVSGDGFALIVDRDQKPVSKHGGAYDWPRLADELKAVKAARPDVTALEVLSEDGIVFDTLVQTMDAAMAAGFPDISLLDAAPGR